MGPKLINKETFFHEHVNINKEDTSGTHKAIKLASESDIVIAVLGEHGLQSGEGRSRTKINLPGLQEDFLKKIFKVNKKIVLVLMNGRPLDLSWVDENIPAVIEAWHLGTMSGEAISSVIYGDYNPSGKLPVSFPRSLGQVPIYYNYKNTGRPGPGGHVFWSHFNDEKNDPLYPFGYGLSYTEFDYSNLNIQKIGDRSLQVDFKVKNIGRLPGKEVVQVYIRDLFSSYTRPVKELKSFKKLSFKEGEEKNISFILNDIDLGFLNDNGELVFEKGEFEIMVGGSSNTTISKKITL
jgi:beta-glucosidase